MTDETGPPKNLSAVKLALMAQRAREQFARIAREPIAIVGLGCRFPGAVDTPDHYWSMLCEGADVVGEIPPDRWDLTSTYDPDPAVPGKSSVRHAGLLDRIDTFDAGFFGIVPREAERMDPQQRLFMEVSIDALDHAGLSRDQLAGSRTGVFVASYHNDYSHMQYTDLEFVDSRTLTGTLHSIIANRLSHFLDLRGPSLSLDSACSSSLVAVHLACQSLRMEETDIALAGGVSVMVSPDLMVALSKVGFTAESGRCRTFDASADGFVRGEGCGVVVLKRLSDAVAAGDRILAVVRSSVVNQDGRSTVMAAPNGLAQQALVREALERAGMSPERISFVEAHGTATPLGDPIEVEALAATIGAPRPDGNVCYLGSVKANMGHLEAAAGVAGLIKATLVLRHRQVPPQAHFKTPNPHFALDGTCLRVPRTMQSLPRTELPHVAGISSFGVGGTNAHVIVEEAPILDTGVGEGEISGPFLLPLSAQSPKALSAVVDRWIQFIGDTKFSAAALCASAGERRSHYDCRLAVIGDTTGELRDRLQTFASGGPSPSVVTGQRAASARLGFVFSGQGPQWYAMGRGLAEREPVFRDALQEIDSLFRQVAAWSLLEELSNPEERSRLDETQFAQPALFALQVALAALWKSWGIVPDGVVGHSIGELAALQVSGALPLADAVRLVWHRARTMQQATGLGAMAAVDIGTHEAADLVRPYGDALAVAACNGPRSVVLSGRAEALDGALAELESRGRSHRRLPVNYAFHSNQMAPIAAEFAASIKRVAAQPPTVPFYSTVTGRLEPSLIPDSNYLARNVREPVQFAAATEAMIDDGFTVFLEIGPHPVLASAIAETASARGVDVSLLASLRRNRSERESMLQACAGVYALGQTPCWEALNPPQPTMIDLPAYPWQRERYWLRTPPMRQGFAVAGESAAHELLGRRIPAASVCLYRASWPDAAPEWLAEHRVKGRLLMPAAAMLEMLRASASEALQAEAVTLEDFVVHRPLVLGDPGEPGVVWQVAATQRKADGRVDVAVHEEIGPSAGDAKWQLIASATATTARPVECDGNPSNTLVRPGPADEKLYEVFTDLGVAFGPRFRTIKSLSSGNAHATTVLELFEDLQAPEAPWLVHPTVLDGALQSCVVASAGFDGLPRELLVPIGIDRVTVWGRAPNHVHAFTMVERAGHDGSLSAEVELRSPDGTPIALLEGVRFAPTDALATGPSKPADDALYELTWVSAPKPEAPADASGQAWIVLIDRQGTGDALATALEAMGARCLRVRAGSALATPDGPNVWTVDPAEPAHFAAILARTEWRNGARLAGLVHFWSLDIEPAERSSAPSAATEFEWTDLLASGSALHALQALVGAAGFDAKLVFVTRGAQAAGSAVPRPAAAGLWGVFSAAAAELADLPLLALDLDPDGGSSNVISLLAEILRATRDSQRVILRGDRHLSPRIQYFRPPNETSQPVQLRIGVDGTLDALDWHPMKAETPGAGDVKVKVIASGLNFRDVLLSLGMYPGEADIELGSECAGIVEEIGPGITQLKVGDVVFGFAPGTLATETIARADMLAPVPRGIPVEIAASLPVAYLTAIFGLRKLAKLRAGMRILNSFGCRGCRYGGRTSSTRCGRRGVRHCGVAGQTRPAAAYRRASCL